MTSIALKLSIVVIASLLLPGLSLAAEANMKPYTIEEVKAACEKAGSSFSQDNGGYGCGTDCRGGKGTDCTVYCPTNAKRCTAQVGGSRHPKTIEQALGSAPERKK